MLITMIVSLTTISAVVVLHYEVLNLLSKSVGRGRFSHRYSIIAMLMGAIAAHAAEVWLFALAYKVVFSFSGVGSLVGVTDPSLLDYAYFSFVTYTTLGFGDIVPTGAVRFMVGTESLVGLLAITWTASFLYLQMERLWQIKE